MAVVQPGVRALTAAGGRPDLRRTALRFLVAGGLNAALNYVLFRLFLHLLAGRAGAAGVAQGFAYVIGVAVGYVVNRAWTFGDLSEGHGHARALPRFLAAYGGTLVVGVALVEGGVTYAGLGPSVSWVLATGVTTVLNFVAQRFWVFPAR